MWYCLKTTAPRQPLEKDPHDVKLLDADRNLFQGELALACLRQDELIAVVELYRALGGGWN